MRKCVRIGEHGTLLLKRNGQLLSAKTDKGKLRVVTNIPWEKYRRFVEKLVKQLSGTHSMSAVDMVESLNRQITGWATFYQYTDYTATICCKADHALFWRFGHWLARKYKVGFRKLMPKFYKTLGNAGAKTWVVSGKPAWSKYFIQVALKKLVSSQKGQ